MMTTEAAGITTEMARAFLAEHVDLAASEVERIGAGAWSHAFGFRLGAEELVVRFGRYVDDFEKDRRAHAYDAPGLPIPELRAIGPAFAGYYAISTRVRGAPLEALGAAAWREVIPSLVAMLEALRLADISLTTGYGGWDGAGLAAHQSWSTFLLSVGADTPDRRTHGWRARLACSPEGEAAFTWGFELLRQVAADGAPRSLIHADLINRNVLVAGEHIMGVFDWGCACYGDHLYDLAWFAFWAPWHPDLDIALLRAALERRWREVGYVPQNLAARLAACYLHIGLDHLAYNAFLGDWQTLTATAERMRTMVSSDHT
jgi:hygromycin-B 4-O-kinase